MPSPTAMISCLSGKSHLTGVRWCLAVVLVSLMIVVLSTVSKRPLAFTICLVFQTWKESMLTPGPQYQDGIVHVNLSLSGVMFLVTKISKYQFWCTSMSCNLEADISFDQLLPGLMNSTELSLATSQSLSKADLLVTENFNLLHHYKTRWRSTKLEQDDSAQKLSPIWFI